MLRQQGGWIMLKTRLFSVFTLGVLMLIFQQCTVFSYVSIQKPFLGIVTIAGALTAKREYNLWQKERFNKKFSLDAAQVFPELNEVFLKIKQDFGIKEKVELRLMQDALIAKNLGTEGFYSVASSLNPFSTNCVYLSSVDQLFPAKIIHNIAHELEHHRQFYKYPGSEPFTFMNWCKNEQGADIAAAKYQRCDDCLRQVANDVLHQYMPHDNGYGYFTTAQGYFSKQDYDSYIEQAMNDGVKCRAHGIGKDTSDEVKLINFLPLL